MLGPVGAWQGRHGVARHGWSRWGLFRWGLVCSGMAGAAARVGVGSGGACLGLAGCGSAGTLRRVTSGFGGAVHGLAGKVRRVGEWRSWCVMAGWARRGIVGRGVDWRGKASLGLAGKVSRELAWHGKARSGLLWSGSARHGFYFFNKRFIVTEKMKIDSIRWKERFPNAGVKAETAHEEIMRIKDKNGGLVSPDDIVKEASKRSNPLHPLFTWDDTEAARKHRLNEAGALLRSIEITYIELPSQPRRAFEVAYKKPHGSEQKQTLYATAQEAAADPENHARLIAEAVRTLMAWRSRFRYLQELSHLMEKIDETVTSLADK